MNVGAFTKEKFLHFVELLEGIAQESALERFGVDPATLSEGGVMCIITEHIIPLQGSIAVRDEDGILAKCPGQFLGEVMALKDGVDHDTKGKIWRYLDCFVEMGNLVLNSKLE